jgi:ATP-dependent Lhr-like helicase
MGDKTVNTIVALLVKKGFEAGAYAGVIEVKKAQLDNVIAVLRSFANNTLP